MRASDFFFPPQLRVALDGVEEFQPPLTGIQREWKDLALQFLTRPSHVEINIQTEAELEIARKKMIQKGAVREERIEEKKRSIEKIRTLKFSLLPDLARRIDASVKSLADLNAVTVTEQHVINHFKNREYIRRTEKGMQAHILGKIFVPLSSIEKGVEASYVSCRVFLRGREYTGYIEEKAVRPFETLAADLESLNILQEAVYSLRDRAENTGILGEYSCGNTRARIVRETQQPPESTSSLRAVLLVAALKMGHAFSKAISFL